MSLNEKVCGSRHLGGSSDGDSVGEGQSGILLCNDHLGLSGVGDDSG